MRHTPRVLRAAALTALVLSACGDGGGTNEPTNDVGSAAISAVIHSSQTPPAPGTYTLGVASLRDAQLIIPETAATCPVPTVVMLHGAGFTPNQVATVTSAAAESGIAVIVPFSRQSTWEIANQSFGEDVRTIDKAIQAADARLCIDRAHFALAGFSDGASFALSLGLANGELFSHVIVFSPGFILDPGHRGKPAFYIGHGLGDTVLPIGYTQQQIVPYLQHYGYTVTFNAFDGGHTVTLDVARNSLAWFKS